MLNWLRNETSLSFWRRSLFVFILGFLIGVALDVNLSSGNQVFMAMATLWGVIFVFLAWFYSLSRTWLLAVSLICFGFLAGQIRVGQLIVFDQSLCSQLPNSFAGIVVAEPIEGQFNQRLIVQPNDKNFKVLVFADQKTVWRYGDQIRFQGRVEKPVNFLTDNGQEFDYQNYLLKDEILCVARGGQIEILAHDRGSLVIGKLLATKNKLLTTINHYLSEPESSLLAGILLGYRSSLDKKVAEDYRRASLSHILVLSGQNISIVAGVLMVLFGWLGALPAFGLTVLGLILFVLMVGSGASVIRATIMGILAALARASGRPYAGGLALVTAGAVMIFFNPRLLVFDLGFQLSFLATLGVFYGPPFFKRWLKFIPDWWQIREIISITLGAILFTSPWLAYSFGQWSLVALPANLLVVPLVSLTMFLGFMTIVLGWFNLPLAWLPAFFTHWLLWWNLKVASFFSPLPWSIITVKNFSFLAVIGCYLAIGLIVFLNQHQLKSDPTTS